MLCEVKGDSAEYGVRMNLCNLHLILQESLLRETQTSGRPKAKVYR